MSRSSFTILILCLAPTMPLTAAAQALLDPPQLVGQVAMPGDTYEAVVMGSYVLVPCYSAGLVVVDASDPAAPFVAGLYDTPGLAIQCALAGNLAFVADHIDGGLQVLNLAAPTSPTYVGDYVSGDAALMAAWHDGIVLVGYIEGRVDVVDVSTPSHPSVLSSFATTGAARHAVFDGPYAFVADYAYGLRVVDISNPSSPSQVGSIVASNPLGVDIEGGVVYLACGNGLRTIDVTTPTAPASMDRVAFAGPAVKVERVGNYALVAAHVAGGLQVVDVTDPNDITVATSYVTGKYTYGVASAGDYAYLADAATLKVFRVFDSTVPVERTSFGGLKARYRGD